MYIHNRGSDSRACACRCGLQCCRLIHSLLSPSCRHELVHPRHRHPWGWSRDSRSTPPQFVTQTHQEYAQAILAVATTSCPPMIVLRRRILENRILCSEKHRLQFRVAITKLFLKRLVQNDLFLFVPILSLAGIVLDRSCRFGLGCHLFQANLLLIVWMIRKLHRLKIMLNRRPHLSIKGQRNAVVRSQLPVLGFGRVKFNDLCARRGGRGHLRRRLLIARRIAFVPPIGRSVL